jgi:hypothetical protein
MSQRDKLRKTRTRATRHGLGVVKARSPLVLLRLSCHELIGFNMKQRQKDDLLVATVGAIVLFVTLYYFIKAIVGFDN